MAFSEKLADTARLVADDGLESFEAKQTVLYLSRLSSEIALKALLEKAGKPVNEIRACSHNLGALLKDIGKCEVQIEIAPGRLIWDKATRLRAVTIDPNYANATIGTLLEAEKTGASKYPNQIRYGNSLKDYPPEMVLKMASEIISWANQHWNRIRVP
jgi:HEPN domain-containing protein